MIINQYWSKLPRPQALFIVTKKSAQLFDGPDRDDEKNYDFQLNESVCVYNLTEREQRVIATIIQWLGTNVGFGFLHEALGRSGYRIVTGEPKPNLDSSDFKKNSRYDLIKKLKKENKVEVHNHGDSEKCYGTIKRRKNQRNLSRN